MQGLVGGSLDCTFDHLGLGSGTLRWILIMLDTSMDLFELYVEHGGLVDGSLSSILIMLDSLADRAVHRSCWTR